MNVKIRDSKQSVCQVRLRGGGSMGHKNLPATSFEKYLFISKVWFSMGFDIILYYVLIRIMKTLGRFQNLLHRLLRVLN